MTRQDKPKRLSDTAQAAIITGAFGLFALLLTQWKDMPWNKSTDAPSAATASEKPAASVQANPAPVAGLLPGNTASDAVVKTDTKPALTQPRGEWIMPARFTINQEGCAGPVEVIGTWEDGVDLRGGVATSSCSNGPPDKGRATGSLGKDHLKLTIEWDTPGQESVGIYEGAVNNEGKVRGISYAQGHREWGTPRWHGAEALVRSQ